ncbi:MupA/Atu3671 family FMN-dependent luciferase-like monooxygenase [Caenimonas aquaedulcis]|uniref:LLM class flavin-dependent oxidoreductase n=1 Tax=Caenimonas aquaedulcis TaxID=2793270 RepID=A0A931H7F5_9BURK|nr:MupA/Atu3671 family FMN-dependent luciferase-like monooxygenase [Caenimonas aquaedulcis]MBG9390066.1 LLM class flavin-dependent oxidoreductase [Caenimonas aquaedulcis]
MAETNPAIFIGNGSLLIQCAQAWRQRGYAIEAVMSESPAILEWATAQGIPALRAEPDAPVEVPPSLVFDYLFSVANLRMLPPALVERARVLAINFHDGPLPRYAGLNATSWALMAREATHGVTWHEMTARADEGRIARQAIFPVSPDDTSLSLNARCYEAGLSTFNALADDITRGSLNLAPQGAGRTYFAKDQRPAALATIDFSRPAADIAALVRALDFGSYRNPLARPKLFTGDRLLCVATARVQEPASMAAPGTVVLSDAQTLRVATGQGDVVLGGFAAPDGEAASHGIAAGTVLPALDAATRAALDASAGRAAKGEAFWTRALASLSPVELPYPRLSSQGAAASHMVRLPLPINVPGPRAAAAFASWLSALTGQQDVSLAYTDSQFAREAQGVEAWLSPWVPLSIRSTPATRIRQAGTAADAAIAKLHEAGAYARDLPSRLGDKAPALAAVRKVALAVGPTEAPAGCDLMLRIDADSHRGELFANAAVFSRETMDAMASHLGWYLKAFDAPHSLAVEVPLAPPAESQAVAAVNATTTFFDTAACIHEAIGAQVSRTPQHEAISFHGQRMSYRDLDDRACALARALLQRGVKKGDIVGLCLERSPDLVVALLAILKAGAAYLPLDPAYPRDRIAFMIEDSATPLVVTDSRLAGTLGIDAAKAFLLDGPRGAAGAGTRLPPVSPDQPAYVIYTSGSTGKPKGVVVTHRNAMNFFAGMSGRVPHDPAGRWLAVTSLSFDISVLELCWTLANGFTIVLHSDTVQAEASAPDFSLFYFAADNAKDPKDRYKLLMEGAKFADREGFSAVWTPERHFHAFGGLYPNPALTSAAIAAVTQRVQIRAGSCVLPLHHPVRVAEEWAFVDNISQGRVGISFAAGWQPNDFVLAPANFADRKNSMLSNIDVVRRLWRGESLPFPGHDGKPVNIQTLPRPVQKELPVWLTAAGNPETFQQAGELGCHLLTHLLGQKVEDVAEKLKLYRAAWRKAGHPGNGHVTLMLHTFVGENDDEVRETVRGPMKEYLRSSVDLIKQAAWSFPTFVQRGAENGKSPVEVMDAKPLSAEEMDALLDHAFSRYYGTSALFGTPARCLELVDKLKTAGVDEIACLIDFGVDPDVVLEHLQDLKQLMDTAKQSRSAPRRVSVAEEVANYGVTHLQCTPSMASMLVADAPGREALSHLSVLMVGGEALPLPLARELRALVPGTLLNMYGPTETTVWSTTCDLGTIGDFIPLGRPIANTQLSVRTPWGAECPALVPGELLIGGEGVTRGYWQRDELTAERFIHDAALHTRLYRTGDLVRRHRDGQMEFLGRIDHQVKLRGHRIELGEIEAALLQQPGVRQAVVIARYDEAVGQQLIGYVTAIAGAEPPQPAKMKDALASALPAIMVPQHVLVLPALPLTPNGKIDRKALPDPRAVIAVRQAGAPESAMEKTIASIWAEVLGLPSVGTGDNFFDLGGHSLLVVQVQRRLREACGRDVSITDMFRLPTVRALAAHLAGGDEAASAVSDGLSRAQARRAMRTRAGAAATAA